MIVRLQLEPITVDALVRAVRRDADGAVASFVGTVRDHNRGRRVLRLEYEAWPEMAEAEMHRLAHEASQRWSLSGVALVQRVGRLEIGETSIAVVVSAAHRADALDACRWLIDAFKQTVPIWKREVFEGGEVWIEGAGESPVRDSSR